jgi:hypothetical protein
MRFIPPSTPSTSEISLSVTDENSFRGTVLRAQELVSKEILREKVRLGGVGAHEEDVSRIAVASDSARSFEVFRDEEDVLPLEITRRRGSGEKVTGTPPDVNQLDLIVSDADVDDQDGDLEEEESEVEFGFEPGDQKHYLLEHESDSDDHLSSIENIDYLDDQNYVDDEGESGEGFAQEGGASSRYPRYYVKNDRDEEKFYHSGDRKKSPTLKHSTGLVVQRGYDSEDEDENEDPSRYSRGRLQRKLNSPHGSLDDHEQKVRDEEQEYDEESYEEEEESEKDEDERSLHYAPSKPAIVDLTLDSDSEEGVELQPYLAQKREEPKPASHVSHVDHPFAIREEHNEFEEWHGIRDEGQARENEAKKYAPTEFFLDPALMSLSTSATQETGHFEKVYSGTMARSGSAVGVIGVGEEVGHTGWGHGEDVVPAEIGALDFIVGDEFLTGLLPGVNHERREDTEADTLPGMDFLPHIMPIESLKPRTEPTLQSDATATVLTTAEFDTSSTTIISAPPAPSDLPSGLPPTWLQDGFHTPLAYFPPLVNIRPPSLRDLKLHSKTDIIGILRSLSPVTKSRGPDYILTLH